MHIFKTAKLYKMTLIVAAHNDKDIVVCSDGLTSVDIDGVKQPDITSQKIIKLNKHTALGVAGWFTASTKQFIDDFCYNNKNEKDISVLKDKLFANIAATLTLEARENLHLMLVGFVSGVPQIKVIEIKPGNTPRSGMANANYCSIGFDGPRIQATKLLARSDVDSKPKVGKLKKIVHDVVNTCINEFGDSDNERLGGSPDVFILYRN